MSKIFIERFGGNVYAALAEGDKLLEFHIENEKNSSIVGNIYKGRVENIINGMQAAFVGIGLGKNAYLSVGDMMMDKNELTGSVDIPEKLNMNVGDEIMVQVIKEHNGSKGVRVTSTVSIAGRYLVYMPRFDFLGVSRKIDDEELRDKLVKFMTKIKPEGGGFIIRTAGAGALRKDLKEEAEYLMGLYRQVEKDYGKAPLLSVVYEEGDLASRMIRDVYTKEVSEVVISDKGIYQKLSEYAKFRKDNLSGRLKFFPDTDDLFTAYNLTPEIDKLLKNRVDLNSGAYLIIDKTEALTVIDVNTGKYTGDKSLEETVFNTNALAAKEIARQVRLRNISGIIIADFIDMEKEEHREGILEILKENLKTDRIKCNVTGMTSLGLVEFTRKKMRKDISSFLLKKCSHCNGEGNTFSYEYIVMKIRSRVQDIIKSGFKSVIIDMNINTAQYIFNRQTISETLHVTEGRRLYVIPHRTYHEEEFRARGENADVLDLPDTARLIY